MARRLGQVVGILFLLLALAVGGAVAWLVWFPDTLKAPLQRVLSAQLGQAVELRGPLRIWPGLVTTVELEGLRVAAPDWAREPDLATLDRLRVSVDVSSYLRDRTVHLTELVLDAPHASLERDAQARTNWPTPAQDNSPKSATGSMPQIDSLKVTDGHVAYIDAMGDVDVAADFATTAEDAGRTGLAVQGSGTVRADPLNLTLQVRSTALTAPLGIVGKLELAGATVNLDGTIRDPASLHGLDMALRIASDDPRSLLALTGRPVEAELPPLAITAQLTRDAGPFNLQIGPASWGDSSIEGQLQADPTAARPNLSGELRSPLLDLVPLWPAFATSAETPNEPETPTGNPLAPLAGYDGELHIILSEVRLPPQLVLRDAEARLKLADGRLSVTPLSVGLPQGKIDGELSTNRLDAAALMVDVQLDANGVGLAGVAGDAYGGNVDGKLAGTLAMGPIQTLLADSRLRFEGEGRDLTVPDADLGSITVTAALADGRLRLDPFRAVLPQGEIAGQIVAGPFDDGFTADVDLEAKGVDLAAAVRIQDVAGSLNGHLTGTLRGSNGKDLLTRSGIELKGDISGLRLPQLESRVSEATLSVTLDPDRPEALTLLATAQAGDRPLQIKAFGGSVASIAANRGDYPFTVEAQLGNNDVRVNGTVSLPLTERKFAATLSAAGPDPSPILALFELPKLQIPPYKVSGVVTNAGDALQVKKLDGRVGDSDVAADLTMNFAGERPKITGEVRSKLLDVDDLGGLVGLQPGTGPGETASPGQRAEADGKADKNQVLPTEHLDTTRWRKFDLDLTLQADEIHAGKIPLDGFSGRLAMTDGLLHLEPLDLRVGDGHVTGSIEADGRKPSVRADVDLQMQRLSMARLLNRLDVDVAAFGTLSGQARGGVGVGGRGFSIKEILANSDGDVQLLMEGGQINRTIVAGLGLDLLRLFGSFIGATPENVPLHCSLVNLEIRDGMVTTRPLIIDTEIAQLGGEGTVNLQTEAIDISLTAQPKKTPLLTDLTGISISGTLAKLELEVNPLALAARGAAAATLGILLKPFTAFAETMDPQAPASCADLLQQAGTHTLPAEGNG
ncbi:MAG: AsmA family protein [Geminicoccaceae bacterium]